MTKKDYILLAQAINKWLPTGYGRDLFALELGKSLKAQNQCFDMERWLQACAGIDNATMRGIKARINQ